MIVLTGPVGSGRTKMLSHLAVAAEKLGYRVLGTDDDPVVVDPTSTIADVRSRLEGFGAGATPAVPTELPESNPNSLGRAVKWVTSRLNEHGQIIELLQKMAPVVVMIDGYSAGSAFGTWFSTVLITHLRGSDGPVAIVVAGSPDHLEGLCRVADLSIALGPLDVDEVRDYLAEGAAQLVPPLTADELERYVDAASTSPSLVSALFDVFQATAQSNREPSQ
jgi:CBS domain-containing protein